MRKTPMAILAAALVLPAVAGANSGSHVDLYYIPSADLKVTVPGFGSASDDGDGYGFKGEIRSGESLAITGEYQKASYDDTDVDFKQTRLGLGLVGQSGAGAFVEYIDADFDGESADGFGVHARFSTRTTEQLTLFSQIGYLSLKDDVERSKGVEFSLGASLAVGQQTAVFADYRRTNLKGSDSDVKLVFTDVRLGLRLRF